MPDAAAIEAWVHGPWPKGVAEVAGRIAGTPGVTRVALMPDVHLASEFCMGMVVASDTFLFPNAVGGDIGCGMLALQFDGSAVEALANRDRAGRVIGALSEACPGRRHHRRLGHAQPEELSAMPLSHPRLDAIKNSEELRLQLGTLGAGNHFLELQADDTAGGDPTLWLMIHTGSRHLGQVVLHHHLPRAGRLESGVFALPIDSPEGRAYIADVAVARFWARENRRLLALRAADVIQRVLNLAPRLETLYDCDHNHVTAEIHAGRPEWVHRKGATAAGVGVRGIIPGSMGTRSFHTVGTGCAAALASSSHGAGRAMSRTEARDRITIGTLRQQLRGVWYDARLERSLREEAPMAYKKIEEVMAAQSELTQIVRRLRPMLVHKGA